MSLVSLKEQHRKPFGSHHVLILESLMGLRVKIHQGWSSKTEGKQWMVLISAFVLEEMRVRFGYSAHKGELFSPSMVKYRPKCTFCFFPRLSSPFPVSFSTLKALGCQGVVSAPLAGQHLSESPGALSIPGPQGAWEFSGP